MAQIKFKEDPMEQGQEMFLGYILERVQEDKIEEAKVLFFESFQKLTAGSFTGEDMMVLVPKAMALLKPECVEEVMAIMTQFAAGLNQ